MGLREPRVGEKGRHHVRLAGTAMPISALRALTITAQKHWAVLQKRSQLC